MKQNANTEIVANRVAKYSQKLLIIAVLLIGIEGGYNYLMLLLNVKKTIANIGYISIMIGIIVCFFVSMISSIIAYIIKKTELTKTVLIMNVAIIVGMGGLFLFLAGIIVF